MAASTVRYAFLFLFVEVNQLSKIIFSSTFTKWIFFFVPVESCKGSQWFFNFDSVSIFQYSTVFKRRKNLELFWRSGEQLQNTPQLIYMSLNKNSVYCVMPRSSKPPDTCKWGGNELRGILKFSRFHLLQTPAGANLWFNFITCLVEKQLGMENKTTC